jgi:hypothetical protein
MRKSRILKLADVRLLPQQNRDRAPTGLPVRAGESPGQECTRAGSEALFDTKPLPGASPIIKSRPPLPRNRKP